MTQNEFMSDPKLCTKEVLQMLINAGREVNDNYKVMRDETIVKRLASDWTVPSTHCQLHFRDLVKQWITVGQNDLPRNLPRLPEFWEICCAQGLDIEWVKRDAPIPLSSAMAVAWLKSMQPVQHGYGNGSLGKIGWKLCTPEVIQAALAVDGREIEELSEKEQAKYAWEALQQTPLALNHLKGRLREDILAAMKSVIDEYNQRETRKGGRE